MSIVLALETSGDVAGIAVRTASGQVLERSVVGARRHAGAILPMVDELLEPLGGVELLRTVLIADGPGSFTGLRVAASVAKALAAARGVEVRVGSSLAARASRFAPTAGGAVLVATSALRGEAYAAIFDVQAGQQGGITERAEPVPVPVADLPRLAAGAAVTVLDLPGAEAEVPQWGEGVRIVSPEAAPSATALLGLLDRSGGTVRLADPDRWEPRYGRPVEAQARWEATHGRPLPHPSGTAG